MYVPPHFAESHLPTLHDFIERHSFGLLVSQLAGLPFATHLPFLLDRTREPYGTLVGHVARANPQWQELADRPALAVFSGPHAYISPAWYEATNVVPTWNYTAVHATGRVELVEEHSALLEIVQRSVTLYESAMPNPWALDTTGRFVERLLDQIVGFRIEIDMIEGKWKMSQNHPVERREKVIRALSTQNNAEAHAVAEIMRQRFPAND
ncbi:FMN-binding negative transcriptional regulator [Frigoriglobus tundricola]|uniref:Transcriptional regulator n=1 Tax=Frigoriglobus tundricola TaxID=2774151 RepID=A0A6M5YZJ9_9BACT|nr:FMN-binding negative transcriptional regulator [Frigoriglobus tundricola]QJW99557.1 Transcriptional regulator [Frigoriglobus tundricola]